MNMRISLGMAIAMMFMVAALVFSITMNYATETFNTKINDLRQREENQAKFAEIDREVRENYYRAIDEQTLLDSVAQGYLSGIGDPYAAYYDAKTYERLLRSEENQAADIGASIRATPEGDGYLIVQEVYADSPAQSQDIREGDLIIRIDEIDLTPENSLEMLEYIQGEQGTTLTMTVRRGIEDTTVTLTRRVVAVPTVYSRMLDGDVGYLLIKNFAENTSDQFNRELRKLLNTGARSLIIDVRDNPGTRLGAAARILDRLLPAGPLVSALYGDNTAEVLYTSDPSELELPIVVLINGGTASAAEVFAQTLIDYDKARTVGATTTGKGVLLERIKLSDGSAIEFTVAMLIPPGGQPFDGIGVKPSYEVVMDGSWQNLDETTDPQLKKALEVAVGMQKIGAVPAESEPESEPEPSSSVGAAKPESSADESEPDSSVSEAEPDSSVSEPETDS